MLGEGQRCLQISERWDGAQPWLLHVLAAELHSRGIRRRKTVRWIVACRARQFS